MKIFNYVVPIFLILSLLSCSQKRVTNEIVISDSLKQKMEEVISFKKVTFYSLKSSLPKNVEEMAQFNLIVTGDIKEDSGLQLALTSIDDIGAPLFNGISKHWKNPNIISGKMRTTENVTLDLENGNTMDLKYNKIIYGKDTSTDTIMKNCFDEMQKKKSVLLVSNNIKSGLYNSVVEIVFKADKTVTHQKIHPNESGSQSIESSIEKSSCGEIALSAYDEPPEPVGGFPAIQRNLEYPESARKSGIEGIVYIEATISKNGEVIGATVKRSLNNELDQAAIAAIRSVKWKPAKYRSNPVKVKMMVPVKFRLE